MTELLSSNRIPATLIPGDGIAGLEINSKHQLMHMGQCIMQCSGKIEAKKFCFIFEKSGVDFTKQLSGEDRELLDELVRAIDWECGPEEVEGRVREVIERILD